MLYQDLIIPLVALDIKETDDFVDICIETNREDFEPYLLLEKERLELQRIMEEILVSGIWATSRQFLSKDSKILEAGFRHVEPTYVDEYKAVFNCNVKFEQDTNYLRVEKELFDKKLYSALPAMHKKAEQQVEQKLKKLKKSEHILNIVKEFIEDHISNEDLNLDNAAKQLHMTARTLQRALRMENTSFIDIRDNVRSDLSVHYLMTTKISIDEISEKVGFSDPSAFYSAFKRWHGFSPGSLRQEDKS